MVQPNVAYCLGNADRRTRRRLAAADVAARPARCLEHCDHCRRGPVVVVDGDVLVDEAAERWLAAVEESVPRERGER